MPVAIEIWKYWAGAIEAHLAFRGINIADWHQGTRDAHGRLVLSSRRLLVLCEHIPEVGGRWPLEVRVLKEIHKEVALHRASLYVGGRNEYIPKLFLDPAEAREIADKARDEEQQLQEVTDELFDSLGFT